MTNKIFAFLTAKNTPNEENQQALVFEELDDSQASAVRGGLRASVFAEFEGKSDQDILNGLETRKAGLERRVDEVLKRLEKNL